MNFNQQCWIILAASFYILTNLSFSLILQMSNKDMILTFWIGILTLGNSSMIKSAIACFLMNSSRLIWSRLSYFFNSSRRSLFLCYFRVVVWIDWSVYIAPMKAFVKAYDFPSHSRWFEVPEVCFARRILKRVLGYAWPISTGLFGDIGAKNALLCKLLIYW